MDSKFRTALICGAMRPPAGRCAPRRVRISLVVALGIASIISGAPHAAAQVEETCSVNGQEQTGQTITGTASNDIIVCPEGVGIGTRVDAGGGDDQITATGIRDNPGNVGTIDGGDGNDRITVRGGARANGNGSESFRDARIQGGAGDDRITVASGGVDGNSGTVQGEDGDDVITVTGAGPGGGGRDGNDGSIEGGDGNDTIHAIGGSNAGTASAGSGNSGGGRLEGGDGDDRITATDGRGVGGSGNLGVMDGENGQDVLTAVGDGAVASGNGRGATIDGGPDRDRCTVSGGNEGTIINCEVISSSSLARGDAAMPATLHHAWSTPLVGWRRS